MAGKGPTNSDRNRGNGGNHQAAFGRARACRPFSHPEGHSPWLRASNVTVGEHPAPSRGFWVDSPLLATLSCGLSTHHGRVLTAEPPITSHFFQQKDS